MFSPTSKIHEAHLIKCSLLLVRLQIMMVVAEEASESYKPDVVKLMRNDTVDDMERNVDAIVDWVQATS